MGAKIPGAVLVVVAALGLLGAFAFGFKTGQDQETVDAVTPGSNVSGKVDKVFDGDTFQLATGKRVRLMGLDAPELNECGGPEAKAYLSELILNQNVGLSQQATEAYGRDLAIVNQGDIFINGKMMEAGWGRPDYRKNTFREEMTEDYHQAQKSGKGLWGMCVSANPPSAKCTIKGNIDTATGKKIYHTKSCSQYDEVELNQAFGEKWFCSEADASEAGFKKAMSC